MFKSTKLPPKEKLPNHIAFIIDGNGRWAKKRGLPREMGHRAGMKTLHQIVQKCYDFGISAVSIYAFSTENWKRPKTEVDALFGMFDDYADTDLQELASKNICIRVMGDMARVPQHVSQKLQELMEKTKQFTKFVLNLGISYGGQDEILHAVNGAISGGNKFITKEILEEHLYTKGLSDPDFIVRTSGEKRLSNFMLWQGAYSELYFPKTFWPDFNEKELVKSLQQFAKRNRRFGNVKETK